MVLIITFLFFILVMVLALQVEVLDPVTEVFGWMKFSVQEMNNLSQNVGKILGVGLTAATVRILGSNVVSWI